MQDRIKVLCQNTSAEIEVEMGITLGELCAQLGIEGQYPILAAYVNNRLKELNSRLFKPAMVRFIDITHFEGYRVYQRTISFILHKAVWDLYDNRKFYIRHSLGRGFYCEFDDDKPITDEEIEALRKRMQEIIASRYPIHRKRLQTKEINGIYEQFGFEDKVALLNTRPRLYSDIYRMDNIVGYFYGALAPDSGYHPKDILNHFT